MCAEALGRGVKIEATWQSPDSCWPAQPQHVQLKPSLAPAWQHLPGRPQRPWLAELLPQLPEDVSQSPPDFP